MKHELPPHPDHTMQWSPREQRALTGYFEPLQKRIAALEAMCFQWQNAAIAVEKQLKELDAQLASGQEPTAWQTFDGEGGYDFRQFAENETYQEDYIKRNGEKYAAWVVPLYTHPAPAPAPAKWIGKDGRQPPVPVQPQQPLTLREMAAAIGTFDDHAINIARAIEVAHGIKEKT